MDAEGARGPLGLCMRTLPPGLVRRTVTVAVGEHLCAAGAAWCGDLIEVDEGAIDVVLPSGDRQRLDAGACLFTTGLTGVELRCAGEAPAMLTGVRRTPAAPRGADP